LFELRGINYDFSNADVGVLGMYCFAIQET